MTGKTSPKTILFLFITLFVLSVTGCSSPTASAAPEEASGAAANNAATVLTPADNSLVETAVNGTLETIYAQVSPSVVHIQVEQQRPGNTTSLFQFPNLPGFPNITPDIPDTTLRAEGSGFVWDMDGHIVTNNHVVANADKITVVFADNKMVEATLVGADPDSDLAVLSVADVQDELHPIQMADSTQLHVGDLAIAIGNPFGQEGTMTVGIISALGRLLPVQISNTNQPQYNIPDVIQTDASINPGNSGGVLLNDQGEVVGVTSAIISPAGASAGVGFAIPSAIVQQVVPALITDGRYDHPYLGISGTSLTPDLAQAADLPTDQMGALIGEVLPDSPADKANLRGSDRQVEVDGQQMVVGGDVITAVNDQPVHSMDDLITYLYRNGKVGETVSLTILRNGHEQTVDVTLQARPRSDSQESGNDGTVANNDSHASLGITGVTVNADLAQELNLDQNQDGVLIEQIAQNSAADEAGLHGSFKPVTINGSRLLVGGDVIIAANGDAVHSIEDLQTVIAQAKPGDKMTLTILRDGKEQDVTLTLGERSN